MRILLIHNYYQYYGGVDTYFDSLTNLLQKKGHTVQKYTKNSKSIESSALNKLKIIKNSYWNTNIEKEISGIIRTFKPDIVHVNNIFPLLTPAVFRACKNNKIPTVHTIHTYQYLCPKGTLFRDGRICQLCVEKRFYYPAILYRCYHNSYIASLVLSTSYLINNVFSLLNSLNMLIFPAKIARDFYLQHLKISEKKTSILSNFVRSHVLKKQIIKGNYFLYVGRFSEEKGILSLLKVVSSLPNINLMVIGDGPLKKEVELFRKFKNIKVKIAAHKNQVFEAMQGALCTIIPSSPLYEFGPIVLMESFANQTPVLAPNAGVFLERVKEGKNGFFYIPNNPQSLKKRIIEINNNKDKIKLLRKIIQTEYEKNYTEDIHYKNLLKIYKKVIA